MPKRDTSDSESAGTSSSSGSESEEAKTVGNGKPQPQGTSAYEEQRLRRIAENRARLEALGLPQMASSFLKGSPQTRSKMKGKEKVKDGDEEYKPEDEEEPGSDSSSEQDGNEKDDDFAPENASGSRKRKLQVKNKNLKMKGGVSGKKHDGSSEYIDEEEALRQAIALSLQDSAEVSYCSDKNVVSSSKAEKKGDIHLQEDKGRKKNKKSFTSRLQLTEDELIVHFFQLDEAGKGSLTMRDIEKAATAHDFMWTDKELGDMIRCFDSDGDRKLSLDDFRKIAVRCNMIKGPDNS